ncbi:hypothetical protein GWK08_05325 [Leptobacterium flavescens]|uniref:CBU-0592-like domain-containing protein n=1 Tax=Leptobacterium flavescens TaxID=472055 RepID=A0A6P0UHN4_9FLAO|nr:hypothetical protein [Leptobacterium flavescens]NER12851.1 hypothetical protein [Leptobacterium flavescens]
MEFHTVLGSFGVALLLIAYVLLQLKKLKTDHLPYAVLNFLGAVMAMWSSFLIDFIPFVVLEGTWALVSLHMIWKTLQLAKPQNQE